MSIKLSELPAAAALTGVELVEVVQDGRSRRATIADIQSPPQLQAEYITLSASPDLPNERIITAGTGVTLTDGGAGGSLTVSVDAGNLPDIQATGIIAGDPGTEGSGITIGGVTYDSSLKVSDLGGTNLAQTILHRHSTTLGPVLVAARSNSDDDTHTLVTDGQETLQLFGSGWDGASYQLNAGIEFEIDGVAAAGDMPGRMIFSTSPAGSVVPLEAMRINSDQSIRVANSLNWLDQASTSIEQLVFTPVAEGGTPATDPNIASVVLLISGETGDNLDESFVSDIGGHTFTKSSSGTAQLSNNQAYFGSLAVRSYYPSGVNYGNWTGSVSDDWDLGSGDWTIEFDIYRDTVSGDIYPIERYGGAGSRGWQVHIGFTGRVDFTYSTDGTNQITPTFAQTSDTIDGWMRLALVRSGNNLYTFENGVQIGTTQSITGTIFNNSTTPIGIRNESGITDMYLDNMRITKGVARYTSNYTVDTAPFSGTFGPDTFIVGDPAYATQIEGLTTRFISASGEVMNVAGSAVTLVDGVSLQMSSPNGLDSMVMNLDDLDANMTFAGTPQYLNIDGLVTGIRLNDESTWSVSGTDTYLRGDGTMNLGYGGSGIGFRASAADNRVYHQSVEVIRSNPRASGGGLIYNEYSQRDAGTFERILSQSDVEAGQFKLHFGFNTNIAASDPGVGHFKFDAASMSGATNMYINDLSDGELDAARVINQLVSGDVLRIASIQDETLYFIATIGTPVDNTGWWTIPITSVLSSSGTNFSNHQCVIDVQWNSTANAGADVTGTEVVSGDWVFTNNTGVTGTESALRQDFLYIDGKEAIDGNDAFLRLNQNGDFASGIYTPNPFRLDNSFDLRDSTGARTMVMSADINDLNFSGGSNVRNIEWHSFTGAFQIRTGIDLELYSAGDADDVVFNMDGTDFNTTFGGVGATTDWNVTGLTGSMRVAANVQLSNITGPAMLNEAASATNPTLVPNRADVNTGIGSNAGEQVSIICNGVEIARFVDSGTNEYLEVRGTMFITEQADAHTDISGDGQLWVRNYAPNQLWFTDDTGDDYPVAMARTKVRTNTSSNMTTDSIARDLINGLCMFNDGSAYTITLEPSADTQFPIESSFQIINGDPTSPGTITINEGSGGLLYYIEPDGTVTDTAGGCTMSSGVATVWRQSASTWFIWGSGITA